jgi:hypothetical protein
VGAVHELAGGGLPAPVTTHTPAATHAPARPRTQVKALLAGALAAAVCVISENKGVHEGLSSLLTQQERVEGEALERWLQHVVVSVCSAALSAGAGALAASVLYSCVCLTTGTAPTDAAATAPAPHARHAAGARCAA